MQPLAVLIGILTGSAVAIAISLILTAVVLMFLPEYAERFAVEWPPLRRATLLFAVNFPRHCGTGARCPRLDLLAAAAVVHTNA
jgi:hypothetical protein